MSMYSFNIMHQHWPWGKASRKLVLGNRQQGWLAGWLVSWLVGWSVVVVVVVVVAAAAGVAAATALQHSLQNMPGKNIQSNSARRAPSDSNTIAGGPFQQQSPVLSHLQLFSKLHHRRPQTVGGSKTCFLKNKVKHMT